MVTRLDRLARSTRDLLNTIAAIADRKDAQRHMGRHDHGARPFDADRAGWSRRIERELIRTRSGEGGERAKARGVRLGRKSKLTEQRPTVSLQISPSLRRNIGSPGRRIGSGGRIVSPARARSVVLGGTQRTYQRMIQQMDLQIGRVMQALEVTDAGRDTCGLHHRQWRGALFRYLAIHRQKNGIAGGWFAHPGGDPLAAQNSVRRRFGAGEDRHGLVPTLLAAAGSTPDPAFPSDGIDLPPVLTEAAAPISRKLFWRYKHNDQQAARGGNWKYLNILDNTRRPSSPQRGRAAAKTIQNLRASVMPRFIVKQGVYSVDKQRKWSRYINHLTGSC